MIRAHKIRLNPTPEQETYLKQACGTSRFAFNWGLARWKEAKEQGIAQHGPMAIKKDFNAIKRVEFPWVLDVTKNAVEDGFRRLERGLSNYFDSKNGKRNGERVGFPRFKSKKRSKPTFTLDYERFSTDGHWLTVSKLKTPINMAEPLRFEGKIKWGTISCIAGKWYISISVEIEPPPPIDHPVKLVGVDLGIKTLATLSDGRRFENQKLLRSELNKLKRLNRTLARRQPGSNRWHRAKRELTRFHERIANRRLDVIHKMTTDIARTYRIVGMEDLNVKGMGKNRKLALSIADASFGEIVRQQTYKSSATGGLVVKVGRFFASSKTCSACGCVNATLTLSDRTWQCVGCGSTHNRDWNASKNIEQEAFRLAFDNRTPVVATSA